VPPWRRIASILWFPIFLAIALPVTLGTALSVPSSGGTVTPDLLPTPFRYLADALPHRRKP